MINADNKYRFEDCSGRKTKYPWLEMEVGQSFPCDTNYVHSMANSASLKYSPKVFKVARAPDGLRIFRIA